MNAMGISPARLAGAVFAVVVSTAPPAVPGTRPAFPETATGILVFPGDHPWGVYYEPGFSWEWARTEQQSRYRLLVGPHEYVPAFAAHGTAGDEIAAARAFGVTSQVHVVEVRAEGGRGPHVAVSSLRVLDGTPEIPWRLAGKLRDLRERFNAARRAHRGALDAEFHRAGDSLRAAPGGEILRDLDTLALVVYHPAWRAESRRLEVFFAYKRQGGFWIKSRRPPRERNAKYRPPPEERAVSYAAAMGARYAVNASGRIFAEEIFAPATFHEVPWAQRVIEGGEEDAAQVPEEVEVALRADRGRLRPGEAVTFTIRMTNRRAEPVWTNPSIICTGSWNLIVRNGRGERLRVDDRDAMGCPSGGVLRTSIEPDASAALDVSWDGRLRPRPGEARAAPPGRYEIEATVRWADRGDSPNAKGPHSFVSAARTSVAITR